MIKGLHFVTTDNSPWENNLKDQIMCKGGGHKGVCDFAQLFVQYFCE